MDFAGIKPAPTIVLLISEKLGLGKENERDSDFVY
jgi:hypothetical protein